MSETKSVNGLALLLLVLLGYIGAAIFAGVSFYQDQLAHVEAPNDARHAYFSDECGDWAFGIGWSSAPLSTLFSRWNVLHGDLAKLHGYDDLAVDVPLIEHLYLQQLYDTNCVVLAYESNGFQVVRLPMDMKLIRDRLNEYAVVFKHGGFTNVNGQIEVRP